ncbi:Subtilase family protein [Phycisphaerae bacterium RAS1]|nr:Subtilase family protein [Phycisphaerae bacterium RAS1]
MRNRSWGKHASFVLSALAAVTPPVCAMDRVRNETKANLAELRYGVTGQGVTVAIMDRGIDWRHPDFIKPDGTTRIKHLLDMTGQLYCEAGNPQPVEYTEAQINAALLGGPPIDSRDAVGHGTVTAGIAAGNGRAFADDRYRGMAPAADLIVVKIVSEGAQQHEDQPAEAPFIGCYEYALDWLDQKINEVGNPCVAIINAGVQYGPMDGTSAVSRKIDQVFGVDRPGRIYATGTGDEGAYPTHAAADYDDTAATSVRFTTGGAPWTITAWYTGSQPAEITVRMDDGAVVGPVPAEDYRIENGISIYQYAPGQEFYPWTSTSGDRAVWIGIDGHAGGGQVEIRGTQPGMGHVDLYIADVFLPIVFDDHLVPGRLSDFAATTSALVCGVYVARIEYIDITGTPRGDTSEGVLGGLWNHSADGPTRDGRLGVDVATPGHHIFAAYGQTSYWKYCCPWNQIQDGGGWYGRQGAASGAGPILVGALALMLEMNPSLTGEEARQILQDTARSDGFTGPTPNTHWGYGKLDLLAALDQMAGVVRGDLNCDGAANVLDINPFVLALLNPAAYAMQFPGCNVHNADINGDGGENVLDINPFVALLLGP